MDHFVTGRYGHWPDASSQSGRRIEADGVDACQDALDLPGFEWAEDAAADPWAHAAQLPNLFEEILESTPLPPMPPRQRTVPHPRGDRR